jgi:protein dithiol oxidoreductase (disulfide-forming)
MKRRDFSTHLMGTGLATGLTASLTATAWSTAAQAQGATQAPALVEGKDYLRLATPLAVPAGKIEVIDFFWYGCPHCYSFEPALDAWAKKLPPDVAFRRLPVMFREEPFGAHARMYYAVEAMGLLDTVHRKIFAAIHNEKATLSKPADISAFMTKNGVDGAKFVEVMNSFSMQSKVLKARQIAEAFKLDGVPALGIQGRFLTSGSIAGTPERALMVTDSLIQRSRKT